MKDNFLENLKGLLELAKKDDANELKWKDKKYRFEVTTPRVIIIQSIINFYEKS